MSTYYDSFSNKAEKFITTQFSPTPLLCNTILRSATYHSKWTIIRALNLGALICFWQGSPIDRSQQTHQHEWMEAPVRKLQAVAWAQMRHLIHYHFRRVQRAIAARIKTRISMRKRPRLSVSMHSFSNEAAPSAGTSLLLLYAGAYWWRRVDGDRWSGRFIHLLDGWDYELMVPLLQLSVLAEVMHTLYIPSH